MGYLSPGAAAALVADGAYVVQVTAPPALPPGPLSNVLAIVGPFTDGAVDTPTPIAFSAQLGFGPAFAKFGLGVVAGNIMANSGIREMISATPECTSFLLSRAADGTQTNASMPLADNTGFASQTFTVGGVYAAGVPLSVTIGATTINYVTTAADATLAGVAASLLAAINASPATTGPSATNQKATLAGLVITARASTAGTAGNAIASSSTGAGVTVTSGGATFAGGAAPGSILSFAAVNPGTEANKMTDRTDLTAGTLTANPVLRVTVNYPNNAQLVFPNIVAYAVAGGGYDAPTFKANALAKINATAPNTIANGLVVATAGPSVAPPALATIGTASGGTDGTTNLTPSSMLGLDAISGRTGMYALRGQSFGGLIIAGNTDPTTDTVIQAFLDQVGGVGAAAYPSSTSTTAAVALRATNNLANRRMFRVEDWVLAPDAPSATRSALVSPLGKFMGIVMSQPPWADISNKPEGVTASGMLGTEKTVNSQPIDPQSEGAQRKTNGISYLTNQSPRSNGLFGIAHGKMSDGSNCSDVRMYDYVAARVLGILARYVGKSQLPPPPIGIFDTDPIRKDCRADFAALKIELTTGERPKMVSFAYAFTGSAPQVAAGYFPWSISGQTLAGIEFAIANLAIGVNVQAA